MEQVNHRKNIWTYSIGLCRMRRFLAILRSFLHSSLLCTFSFHPSPPTIPPSLTSSCHLFLDLPLCLAVAKFIYNTLFLGIPFSSILCTCPNQCNLFNPLNAELNPICYLLTLLGAHHFLHVSMIRVNHTVSIMVGDFNHCINFIIG